MKSILFLLWVDMKNINAGFMMTNKRGYEALSMY